MFIAMFAMIGIAYANTPVPAKPKDGAEDQASIFYYAGGKQEIGRIGKKREIIDISKIPPHAQDAVLAAENRSFRTDPGFSPKAITRAVLNNVTGGPQQGGSTITQQLAKNYYSDIENRTMKRKFQELFISVKLEDEKGKDEILELYLNTIYYGRNTYGIQAAAREYFGITDISKIKKDQAALLAGIIQNPNRDPADKKNVAWATERYQYVLGGMVTMGKMTEAEATQLKQRLPKIKKRSADNINGGQKGYMLTRAVKELERQGISEKDISSMGLRVHTTFNANMMDAAKKAVEQGVGGIAPGKVSKKIEFGLVAVEPGTGKVRAIYGGRDFLKDQFDNVWASQVQPGSTFKPYVLATALKENHSLKSLTDARSPLWFSGGGEASPTANGGYKVVNGSSRGVANLIDATKYSINTSYVQLALQVGLDDVIKVTEDFGVAGDQLAPHRGQAGLALGQASIRPVEQAAGFATFAAGGRYYQPRVLEKVLESDNKTRYKTLKYDKHQAVSADIAADVTYALQAVTAPGGTGQSAKLPNRPTAGKTGTTNKNVASWFTGYVPQLATAVAMWNVDQKTMIVNGSEVQGGTVPAGIWRAFMVPATQGMEVKSFPPPANVGQQTRWATPRPTPTPSADTGDPMCRSALYRAAHPDRCDDQNGGGNNGNQNVPCERPNQQNCNPNLPPTRDGFYKQFWCRQHPGHPACRPTSSSPPPDDGPGLGNNANNRVSGRLPDD